MLRLLMICIAVILMTLIITQVLKPAFNGELLFPLFRSKLRRAEAKLREQEVARRIKDIEVSTLRLEIENEQLVHNVLDELIDDDQFKEKRK